MPDFLVSVVIPTLVGGSTLRDCVESLEQQTRHDFEVIIADNSGQGLVRRNGIAPRARILENSHNLGFGTAINEAVRASSSAFVATLNDDAVAHPRWLEALLTAIERRPEVGMCASQVRLFGEHRLDSAGMLVSGDGSSKQRGHLRPPEDFPVAEEALFPSGSAALYRRAMLEAIGGFDDRFFLYCEDTDLGLRARWAGWKCLYVPEAVVEHHYSHSAGRASPLKAYYVERNRLFVLAKNFPVSMLLAAPWVTLQRYLWHAWYLLQGRGSAARFRADGNVGVKMPWYVIRAHFALAAHARQLWRDRREIRKGARVTPAVFRRLLHSHSISPRKVAAL
ncbi:MAG TPA: glycosyltransferase family 2 protein [Bryobacteraceae bacterium]|nr:glycosyltransferase family 2 protein [Bryobacteraceae bacterium]